MYEVNFWGSHPDSDGDDCWYGSTYQTEAEALQKYREDCQDTSVAYIELVVQTGNVVNGCTEVDSLQLRKNPHFRPEKSDDWRRELAMEAGMLHGVAAYNEVMGWD